MAQVRSSTGRISDLVGKLRSDWSHVKAKLKVLDPGETITFVCPFDMTMPKFRSTVQVIGGRLDFGDWKLATHNEGRRLTCYLVPKE